MPARARPATGSLDTPQHLRHGDTVLLPSACLQPALQVYSLPPAISPNTWLLNTHYDQLERRYGGWQFGAGRGREQLGTADSITIVHYNNKVLYNLFWFCLLHLWTKISLSTGVPRGPGLPKRCQQRPAKGRHGGEGWGSGAVRHHGLQSPSAGHGKPGINQPTNQNLITQPSA